MIQNQPIEYNDHLPEDLLDLLKKILNKDPAERYTLDKCKHHPWLAGGKQEMFTRLPTDMPITVNADEIRSAFTLSDSVVLMVKINMKMKSKLAKVRRCRVAAARQA